jgi:hypothetical protein
MHAKPRFRFDIEIGFCLPDAGKTLILEKMYIISAELWLEPEKINSKCRKIFVQETINQNCTV